MATRTEAQHHEGHRLHQANGEPHTQLEELVQHPKAASSVTPAKETDQQGTQNHKQGVKDKHWFLRPAPLAAAAALVGLVIAVAVLASQCPSGMEARGVNKAHPSPEPCHADWMYYRRTCYYFTKERLDWDESRSFCSSHNATLIVIESHEELEFLMEYLYHGLPWIGLHKTEVGGDLKWVTGAPYNQSLYEIDLPGECAYLQPDSIFLSSCHFTRPWLCKKQPDH